MQEPETSSEQRVPLAERHPPVWWATRRFQFHLDALREILGEFLPRLDELDDKHFSVDALARIENLPDAKREELQQYLDERIAAARAGDPPSAPTDEAAGEESTGLVQQDSRSETSFSLEISRIDEIFGGDRHFTGAFMLEIERLASGPRRVTILHNSLLAMAIGAFEVLVAGIATQFFVQNQTAIESDEKVFSFAELRDFDDVDDAADEIISRRITGLMYDGLGAWKQWFKNHCQVDFEELAMNFSAIQEAFQRRHVVLHNGGLASRQYLLNVGDSGIRVGDRLPVDANYLNAAFDELDTLGTSLGTLAEGTWHPEHRNYMASVLLRRCYELMVEARWEPAQTLASLGQRLECESITKSSLRCNEWLCRAERFGYESVREVVSNELDTSDMAPRFQLVKQILLEDLEPAMASIPSLISSKEITRGELIAWPILRKVREHADFDDLLAKIDADTSNS